MTPDSNVYSHNVAIYNCADNWHCCCCCIINVLSTLMVLWHTQNRIETLTVLVISLSIPSWSLNPFCHYLKLITFSQALWLVFYLERSVEHWGEMWEMCPELCQAGWHAGGMACTASTQVTHCQPNNNHSPSAQVHRVLRRQNIVSCLPIQVITKPSKV